MNIRGIEIELHENEDLSNHIRSTRDFFEPDILDYIRDNHGNHGTIVDIGANIGNHSVYFANFLRYETLICFEPIEENYRLLERNMGKYGGIGLAQSAVGNFTGITRMRINRSNMGASEIRADGETEVSIIALDRVHLHHVTLMKIDVEWHEPEVIEGAQDTIYRCKPLILLEDANFEYAKLLPGYKIERAWPQHKTYLYRWQGDQ